MFFLLMIASCFAFAESDLVRIEPYEYDDDGSKKARIIFSGYIVNHSAGEQKAVEVSEVPTDAPHYPYLIFYADPEKKKKVAETNRYGLFIGDKKICAPRKYKGIYHLCANRVLQDQQYGDILNETSWMSLPIVRRVSGNVYVVKTNQLGNLIVDISSLEGLRFLGVRHPSEDMPHENFLKPFYSVQWSDSYYRKRFLDSEPLFKEHLEKFDKCVLAGKADCLKFFNLDREEVDKFVKYFTADRPNLKLSSEQKEKDISLILHYCLNRGGISEMKNEPIKHLEGKDKNVVHIKTKYGFYDKESKSVIIGQGNGGFSCLFSTTVSKEKGVKTLDKVRANLTFTWGAD